MSGIDLFNIWLDDLRLPPTVGNWVWVKNYAQTISLLEQLQQEKEPIFVMQMDHDLTDSHYKAPWHCPEGKWRMDNEPGNTGYDILKWMVLNLNKEEWPLYIVVHSMNPYGSVRMYDLASKHTNTILRPYTGRE